MGTSCSNINTHVHWHYPSSPPAMSAPTLYPRSIPQLLYLIPFHLLRNLTHRLSLLSSRDTSMEEFRFFQSAVKEIQVLRQNKIKNLTPSPIPLFPSDTCNFSISRLSSQTSWKNSRHLLSSPSTESSPGGHYFHSHHSNQKGVQHSHHNVPFPKSNGFSFQSLPCFSAALEAFECSPCFKPFRFSLFWTCPWVR